MTIKTKNGTATISIALALSLAVACIGGVATFFQTSNTTDTRISEVKTELKEDLASSRERIRALEEACDTIKINTTEIRDDIKTLLQR